MALTWHLGSSAGAVSTTRTSFSHRCSLPDKIKKSQKRRIKQRRQHQQSNHLGFPNSSPTPILINLKPQTRTKIEALECLVHDLESSAKKGVTVDTQTFCSILETCFQLGALDFGIRIHRLIPTSMLRRNTGVASKLLRLYAANGRMEDAHQLFDEMSNRDESTFAWNSMISGYADMGEFEDALALYLQMEEEGVEPDRFTFPRALRACSGLGSIRVGEEIHRHVVRHGFFDDGIVHNSLVDMYAKCGDIVRARKVFDKIKDKDLVSWNSMITAYVHHDLLVKAVDIFQQMLSVGEVDPDEITISSILTGSITALRLGTEVHGWVLRQGWQSNLAINNSLIALYSHHGLLLQARWLFKHMPEKDIVSWNSIISAHSKDTLALVYFQDMEDSGTRPDIITFVSLLSTCAYLVLVEDGDRIFSLMKDKYGIAPIMEHYACIVNLYGRAGMINEAYDIVCSKMEYEASESVWGALLYGCYLHKNVEIGELAAHKLFDLEPDNERNFELLIGIYQRLGRVDDAERVKKMLLDRGLDEL
ncbi:hypothetical protein V2J09_014513 [Rumex salicifolius]